MEMLPIEVITISKKGIGVGGKKAFSNYMPEGNSPLGLLLVCVQFIACSNFCKIKALTQGVRVGQQ